MTEKVMVLRWDEFRLMRPLPPNHEEFLAMLKDRKLGFNFGDDPALYVRKMIDRVMDVHGEYLVDTGGPGGEPYRVDWQGFADAVRKYHGDEEAAKVLTILTHLTDGADFTDS